MSALRVLCFGDSITRGESDALRGGWADRLKTEGIARFLERGGEELCVFNLGIGGETTAGLRARFLPELAARRGAGERLLAVLAYGANDAAERDGRPLLDLPSYLGHLRFCIEETKKAGGEVLLLSVTPVAPAVDGKINAGGVLRSNARIRGYNAALRELAASLAAGLVDVHAEFMKRELPSLFAPDGIHPNAAGHELIRRLVGARLGF